MSQSQLLRHIIFPQPEHQHRNITKLKSSTRMLEEFIGNWLSAIPDVSSNRRHWLLLENAAGFSPQRPQTPTSAGTIESLWSKHDTCRPLARDLRVRSVYHRAMTKPRRWTMTIYPGLPDLNGFKPRAPNPVTPSLGITGLLWPVHAYKADLGPGTWSSRPPVWWSFAVSQTSAESRCLVGGNGSDCRRPGNSVSCNETRVDRNFSNTPRLQMGFKTSWVLRFEKGWGGTYVKPTRSHGCTCGRCRVQRLDASRIQLKHWSSPATIRSGVLSVRQRAVWPSRQLHRHVCRSQTSSFLQTTHMIHQQNNSIHRSRIRKLGKAQESRFLCLHWPSKWRSVPYHGSVCNRSNTTSSSWTRV